MAKVGALAGQPARSPRLVGGQLALEINHSDVRPRSSLASSSSPSHALFSTLRLRLLLLLLLLVAALWGPDE